MQKINITTKEQARDYAIEWQQWAGDIDLSYMEIVEWSIFFEDLAQRFGLIEEFKENGII
jgi:hypothetical protein